jgi:hypothetical protein
MIAVLRSKERGNHHEQKRSPSIGGLLRRDSFAIPKPGSARVSQTNVHFDRFSVVVRSFGHESGAPSLGGHLMPNDHEPAKLASGETRTVTSSSGLQGGVRAGKERALNVAGVAGAVVVSVVIWVLRLFSSGGARYSPSAYYIPDDVFIELVYARHLVQHGRIYWNVQDGPVDGFTSTFDMLLKSAALRLFPGADALAVAWTFTVVYCVLLAALASVVAIRLVPGWPPLARAAFGALGGIAVSTQAGFNECVLFLLETPLFVDLSLIVILLLVLARSDSRPPTRLLPVLLFALSITRPEGLFLSCVVLAFFAFSTRDRISRRTLAWTVAGYALAMLSFFVLRIALFGYWAPNTYYAKTSATWSNEIRDGVRYVFAFLATNKRQIIMLAWLLLSPAYLIWGHFRDGATRLNFGFVSVLAGTSLALVVFGGGDCYPGARFLALPWMLSTVALLIAVAGLRGWGRRIAQLVFAVVLTIGLLGRGGFAGGSAQALGDMGRAAAYLLAKRSLTWQVYNARPRAGVIRTWEDELVLRDWGADATGLPDDPEANYLCDVEVGRKLDGLGLRVLQSDYQRLKYFADDLYVRDLHGLNDRVIAHQRFTEPVLWGKASDANAISDACEIWICGSRPFAGVRRPMARLNTARLFSDQRLFKEYTGRDLPTRADAAAIVAKYTTASLSACGGYFNFLVRREFASKLASAGVVIGD